MREYIIKKSKNSFITKGSYTVEAAFIVPIIIFVIMALIYMSFYLHDKARIQAIIHENLLEGGLIIKHEWNLNNNEIDYINIDKRGIYYPIVGETEDEINIIEDNLWDQLSHKLYIAQINGIVVEGDHWNISIKVDAVMNISILKVREFFTGSGTTLTLSSNGRIHYPAEFIRQFSTVEGVIEDRDGYNGILEKLSSFLK